MHRNKRVPVIISTIALACTFLLLNGLICPPPNGNGGEGEGENGLTACKEGPEQEGFVVLFSLSGETVLESSFVIPVNGTFRVLITDLAQASPDPIPYDFTLNDEPFESGLVEDAFFELDNVPGCETVAFEVDLNLGPPTKGALAKTMFDLGTGEILFVLALGLIILGPEKLPQVMRYVSRAYSDFRRYADDLKRDLRNDVSDGIRQAESDVREIQNEMTVPRISSSEIIDPEEILTPDDKALIQEAMEDDVETDSEDDYSGPPPL